MLNSKIKYFNYYKQFLRLEQRVVHLSEAEEFSAIERAHFEFIVLAWGQGKPLTVSNAMRIDRLGSTATQHKRVVRLRKMGFIENQYQLDDHRIKFLVPTAKGLKYVSLIGQLLLEGGVD